MSDTFPCALLPKIHPDARPFWDACAQHRLVFQRCGTCGHIRWPASVLCPACHGSETQWTESQGRGTVYSFVVFHRAFHPTLEERLPYVVATVDLDEGPTLLTNIVGCDTNRVYCGQRVEVQWQDVRDGLSLPLFHPVPTETEP